MSATIWRCECGAKYEIPEAGLGGRVSCSHCGAVSRIEKPPRFNAPPPLPRSRVPSRECSGKRPIAQGNSAAAFDRESKKPELFKLIWVAGILGTGTLLLLLLVSVFSGGSTSQQQVENAQPPSVDSDFLKLLAEVKGEMEVEARRQQRAHAEQAAQAHQPPADVPSNMPTGKIFELADLAELVSPSVVQVNVTGRKKAGTGSGFVLDKQGTIVTNYHVIEDATAGTIVFSDRTSAPITGYLGVWPEKDIALVQVECPPDKLHPIRLAMSAPRQGERVAAFGSPLGLQQSVSEGIVSALRESEELRTLGPIDINARLIQTTTPISPGNSGGPLVDMKGMVVGVNTMGLLGGENLNFAVAIAELPPLLLAKRGIASPLPANAPAGSVRRIMSQAKDHYDAGDYHRAIADYTAAIRLDPKNAIAFSDRGYAYMRKGDDDSAIADFTEAIRLDPKQAFHYSSRGVAYSLKRDYGRAIADYTKAIRLNPKNPFDYSSRGDAYREKRDYDLAIADYTEAIRLDPKKAKVYWNRGKAYELKGQKEIAKRDFEQATKLGYDPPDSKTAKHNPGKTDSKVAEKEAFPERSKVRDRWKKIVIGMPYPQVEKLLGRPNDVATFGNVGAHWTYRFEWTAFDGLVSFDGNGRVTGWSEPSDWKLNK